MPVLSTILSYTNIVLTVTSLNSGLKKFAAFDGSREVLKGFMMPDFSVDISANMFEHPLESGAVVADHRILNPKKISVTAYISLDDITTLKELNYYYLTSTPLKIRAENYVINNAYIENQPFKVSGSCIDKTQYTITFKEAEEISPVYIGMSKARNKSNSSRVNSGQKQGATSKSWLFSAIRGGRT